MIMSCNFYKNEDGYMALVSTIIVSILLTGLTATLATTGYWARFDILNLQYKTHSYWLAQSCNNLLLIALANNREYAVNEPIHINGDTCTASTITHNPDSTIDLTSTGIIQGSSSTITVKANTADLSLISQKEVP